MSKKYEFSKEKIIIVVVIMFTLIMTNGLLGYKVYASNSDISTTNINNVAVDFNQPNHNLIDLFNKSTNELLELGGYTYNDLTHGTQTNIGTIGGASYITLDNSIIVFNDFQTSLDQPELPSTFKIEMKKDSFMTIRTPSSKSTNLNGGFDETVNILGEPIEVYKSYNPITQQDETTMKYKINNTDSAGTIYYHKMLTPDLESTSRNFLTLEKGGDYAQTKN